MLDGLSIKIRRLVVFLFDLIAIGLAFTAAFLLRFDFKIPAPETQLLLHNLPWIYLIQCPVFISFGLYRGLWSFASLRDLSLIVRSVALAVVLSLATMALSNNHLVGWPRSVFVLDGFLLVLILGGGRFAYRYAREFFFKIRQPHKRTIVIGAGHSANLIAREFATRPELASEVVGFLDDNPALRGVQIQRAPVLGPLSSLSHWLERMKVDEIIIAIPSLPGTKVKEIVAIALDQKVPCRICPPIRDVLLGNVQLNQLREVRVEDLLRRDVVQVDEAGINSFLRGRRVLITGAGGSIGSELCRQVLKFEPAILVLFERSEFNLYKIEQELNHSNSVVNSPTEMAFIIGDILNEKRLSQVFDRFQPEIVLHAAAYKHVPLMEENIFEALQNNVLGTYQLAKTSVSKGVKTFVLISTDKAVRPSSVMGATKRMAELVTHAIGHLGSMRTVAVRFGNVLDSAGSVLPLFREQIAQGGPVTVTDPQVTRYFMTIPEASQLVLQATLLGYGGEVFLLDMGEPVLIKDLAEELIKISGLRPYEDIDIVFTGLRKGEKLYEELLIDMNHAQRTTHPKIVVSTEEHRAKLESSWAEVIEDFKKKPVALNEEELLNWIHAWVPECALHRDGASDPGETVALSESAEALTPKTLH